ncbi:MAG: AAA family ATPase [Bacteroidales bacterium]|nr:AAA family ATPase [Bacteroidales bacterium]
MKIRAFHIKNYRSIVNSGWCYLSHDNITALIGQNESGKTSVLESLRSFYEGNITEDVLRSDQSFPEITCIFEFEDEKFTDLIDIQYIPPALQHPLQKKHEIKLTRKWLDAKNSSVEIAEPEIIDYFNKIERENEEMDRLIMKSVHELSDEAKTIFREVEGADRSKENARAGLKKLYEQYENARRIANKMRKPDEKIAAQMELEKKQLNYQKAEAEFNHKLKLYEDKKSLLQFISEKLSICKTYAEIAGKLQEVERDLGLKNKQCSDLEHQHELCSNEKERKIISGRIQTLRSECGQLVKDLKDLQYQFAAKRKTAAGIFSGKDGRNAEDEAIQEIEEDNRYYKPEQMGNMLFKHIPLFEFFEDFGSLLPNKIDLEDLLNENSQSEGYKAARNFLGIAGLDAEFFRERNHRILKQKIENLNGEISIDFQDYWQQNVGKNNKIKINFELEHYDYTVPEKSGKPYLEFWIKDKQERLYPKQRSRGVRWFLSFYLELKATAKQNHVNRVMLIDEPGLSLHARAQEDVLKVFEDLKDTMQIIYCTHSPHLIDSSKLYRVMAVQRANDDENSETVILDPRSLHEASSDTLSPIYALMGTRLSEQSFISPKNNIVVEDVITYYYMTEMAKLLDFKSDIHFLPANGMQNIPLMVNLLLGWKLDFGVLIMENQTSQEIAAILRKTVFLDSEADTNRKVKIFSGFAMIEDFFTTLDFKRFVLQQRAGITERNSRYIEENELSRTILATNFSTILNDDHIALKDFDEETVKNFTRVFKTVEEIAG